MAQYQVDGKPYSFFPSGPQKTIVNTWVKPAFDNIEPVPDPIPPADAPSAKPDTTRDRTIFTGAVLIVVAAVLLWVLVI
jgi:hypothetical protein